MSLSLSLVFNFKYLKRRSLSGKCSTYLINVSEDFNATAQCKSCS